ncbi:NAD(P)-binding protein [Mycobacterium antarcticum]|uniref:NAD(P)-binding protein n=1 Tax=Mycolicibacterium sp. TUM20983 TaxID=3023369 RepID=UPI0024E1259A|nr:NAD(P)-binding protein [Mycolicibacterium sp. TUM20983]
MTNHPHSDVIIVGAGAAGLAAATAAEELGLTVRVFEAQDHQGGRVRTRHTPRGDRHRR